MIDYILCIYIYKILNYIYIYIKRVHSYQTRDNEKGQHHFVKFIKIKRYYHITKNTKIIKNDPEGLSYYDINHDFPFKNIKIINIVKEYQVYKYNPS